MNKNAQGSLEYLLLVAGGVLIVAIVIYTLAGTAPPTAGTAEEAMGGITDIFKDFGGRTTIGPADGDGEDEEFGGTMEMGEEDPDSGEQTITLTLNLAGFGYTMIGVEQVIPDGWAVNIAGGECNAGNPSSCAVESTDEEFNTVLSWVFIDESLGLGEEFLPIPGSNPTILTYTVNSYGLDGEITGTIYYDEEGLEERGIE